MSRRVSLSETTAVYRDGDTEVSEGRRLYTDIHQLLRQCISDNCSAGRTCCRKAGAGGYLNGSVKRP